MAKPEPSIFDEVDEEADRRSEAEADADVEAGRYTSHAEVSEWLKTLGTPDQKPAPYLCRK